ncbi:MAG: LysE family translocator [Sedimenticola sp.]|nr:LysE family translocator [Sedimenticola sp.]
MSTEAATQWILIFGPLAISPGPANVLFGALGNSFGVRDSIPFWLGTNITCIFQSLAIGLGLGYVISTYPAATVVIKFSGIVFLLYLAYRFFRLSVTEEKSIKPLSFKEGVVVELLNAKYLMIPTIMFTQFFSPENDGLSQVFVLTLALAVLTMSSNMAWVFGGKVLTKISVESKSQKGHGMVFGLMLGVTALWLLIG